MAFVSKNVQGSTGEPAGREGTEGETQRKPVFPVRALVSGIQQNSMIPA